MQKNYRELLKKLVVPAPQSHKGQNGKLLIIGGSELFHVASKWSLDVASRFVDMVFYASVPSNNQLIKEAKSNFWNGIVIDRSEVPAYIEEADCILIGPGMLRTSDSSVGGAVGKEWPLDQETWNTDTKAITDSLLARYPNKKWVIDAGALQMVDPKLLNQNCLITPHAQEIQVLAKKLNIEIPSDPSDLDLQMFSSRLQGATILLKGSTDLIADRIKSQAIEGGNPGMTKGGTGDVLAGLAAGLYATSDIWTSAVTASLVNKKAGEALAKQVGPFFNASDLASIIPGVIWQLYQEARDRTV
jgi:NAD(P)H-hydrate epimerase